MRDKEKQKMCWNCEADISRDATYCPLCGYDLISSEGIEKMARETSNVLFSSRSLDDSLASLYKPPYSVRDHEGLGIPRSESPRKNSLYGAFPREDEARASDDLEEEPLMQRKLGGGWPLILLSIGGQLMTLGLLLFFFSTGGKLTLEWNAKYWFIYCLAALPILYFGWRMVNETTALDELED